METFFFYGTLCHAPLLETVLGRRAELRPAELADHAVHWARGEAFPLIVAAPGGRAAGALVAGLSPQDVARLDYYEGGFAYAARSVLAQTAPGAEAIAARVYFPDQGAGLSPGAPWSLSDWVAQVAEIAVEAAREFMAGFGHVPAEVQLARYPTMLTNAAARVNARAGAPTTLRQRVGQGDIALRRAEMPYHAFFTLSEYHLRFRRFDGAMSPEVKRAVFQSGDAATVLPYDPRRDRVALIEQFRPGPYARGDAQPWKLEAIAGRVDPGEAPDQTALREAQEEAGLRLGRLWKVAGYYSSPGASAEYVTSFIGEADLPDGLSRIGGLAEEEEDIRLHILSFDALMSLVESGEAEIAPLLISIGWLAANRARLRAALVDAD